MDLAKCAKSCNLLSTLKVFMKTNFNFYLAVLMLCVVAAVSGCRKKVISTNSNVSPTKPYYQLFITGADGVGSSDSLKTITGDRIQATWDDELGTIWLGTDQINLPVATITMEVVEVDSDKEGLADNIYISTTDARTGTAADLNAKLYYASSADLWDVEVGGYFIIGKIKSAKFTEVSTNQKVLISLNFIAMDN